MEEIISTISSYVWSAPLVILCLAAGLYFSIGTRFVQVRRLGEMARLLFSSDKTQKTGISSFQAFAMALSGRVGTGNIVGVATAIGYGGPGAIVWMWIIAFLGAGSAFAEATLAQVYKEEHNGQFRGGPSYYIEKGLKCKWLAIIFAVCSVLACGFFLPPIHSNGIATAFSNAFGINTMYVGIIVAILIGLVIIGGVKRIANVAQIIAPLMAIIYILLSIVVLICNAEAVPAAFKDMISSAFGMNEALGGILGSTIAWGVKRGIYSNEAGQGTGPIVAAAAKVSHPVKQGLVQAFSVYITKTYNIYDGDGGMLFTSPVAQLGEPDVSYTSTALGTLLGASWGNIIISVALFFFAFTTIMAYYYYAETNVVYLLGNGLKEKIAIWCVRISVIGMVFFGSLHEAKTVWDLGDIGVGSMAWINVIAILLLSPKVFRLLRSYEKQKMQGKEPEFNPEEMNISNVDFWKKKNSANEESVRKKK